jgi:hypothetical protein
MTMMCSRRTIMSGEVVTFATSFEQVDEIIGERFDAEGPFEVSASRDAVIVHRAECSDAEQVQALIQAIKHAEDARSALAPHWQGGHPSMYPCTPTRIGL